MRVLDVGCGSGTITEGIARAVQPDGAAVGLDRDAALIERARAREPKPAGLSYRVGSVLDLAEHDAYDVVTAARALQWIPDADAALARMVAAVRPRGIVLVLDYDHADLVWEPRPPDAVRAFYDAFLAWREAGGLDNRMGSSLPERFARAGLTEIRSTAADEVVERAESGFASSLRIWGVVMADIGPEVVRNGHLSPTGLAEAARDYARFCAESARRQHMVLRAVEGTRPG